MSGAKAIGITPDGKLLVQPGTRRRAKKKPAKLDAMTFTVNGETHSIMVPKVKATPVVRPFLCTAHTVKRGDVFVRGISVAIVFDVTGNIASVRGGLRTRGACSYRASKMSTFALGSDWQKAGQKEANGLVRKFVRDEPALAVIEGLIAAPAEKKARKK